MVSVLKINMLGEFSITYGDKMINDQLNRSKKVWTLLEYLITFRGREISQNELIELLWPEESVDNPMNTLKTLLHRVRTLVDQLDIADSKKIIVSRGGTYAWNPSMPSVVDTEVFENLCQQALSAENDMEERIKKLLEAIEIYRGDFLPQNALDSWVVPINAYYHSLYIKVVGNALECLQQMNRNSEIIELCQKAIVIDPYEEFFHYRLIKTLVDVGKHQQALTHYKYTTDLFFNKFGITPSKELVALYKKVIKTFKSPELDLHIIREGLEEEISTDGCFYCEYEFFKSVYQLEARSAARTGQTVYVGLITLTDTAGFLPSQKLLNSQMERLRQTTIGALRRGDVVTRYSVSQYLVMLSAATFENCDAVMQRIVKTFRRGNPKSPVTIHYSLQPLIPLELRDI